MAKAKPDQMNWEKIGVYTALMLAFWTCIFSLMDIKERLAKAEVKIEKLEEKKGS